MRRLGFEAGHVTVSQWEAFKALTPDLEWVSTTDVVSTLRLVKDAGEVETIRRAIAVAEAAFESVKPLLRPGTREQDFAIELEFTMRRGGGRGRRLRHHRRLGHPGRAPAPPRRGAPAGGGRLRDH